MAGRPLQRACFKALDAHEDEIFDRLAAGEFVTELCRDYLAEPYAAAGKDLPHNAGNYHLYKWLDAEDGRRDRFDKVRESAADALAEESVRIVDEAREDGVASTAEATLAKEQGRARRWIASKLNQAKYGDNPNAGVNVTVDIADLHLQALKQAGSMEHFPGRRGQSPGEQMEGRHEREMLEADAEVVEDPADAPAT